MKYTDFYRHLNESYVDKKTIEVPKEAGTVPIPSNHLRLYHYTDATPEELKKNGLLLSKARGRSYGEPNFVWASLKKPNDNKRYVEFSVPIDDPRFSMWGSKPDSHRGVEFYNGKHNDFTFEGDIKPDEFIAIHEPWHYHYRYIAEDPSYIEATLNGKYDYITHDRFPDEAKAIDAIKTNFGNQSINESGVNHEHLEKQYADLGNAQRGEPETLGTKQHRLLQGSLSYPLEHIGDLVHRLSYNEPESQYHGMFQGGGGPEYGRDAAISKINSALRYAKEFDSVGGMEKYVKAVAQNNYSYVMKNDNYENYKDWDTEWNNVMKYLNSYADAHRKLRPLCYSYYQKIANDATVALGEMNQNKYVNSLNLLKKLLSDPKWKNYWYSDNI